MTCSTRRGHGQEVGMRVGEVLRGVLLPVVVLCAAGIACGGGETTGENGPGGETELDPDPNAIDAVGGLAVEADEAHVWVVQQGALADEYGSILDTRAWLTAIDPVTAAISRVVDVGDSVDRRIVFPSADRALLLEEVGPQTRVTLLDADQLAPIAVATKPGTYTGARTSPTGRFVVVTDVLGSVMPVRVIDSTSLADGLVPQYGQQPQGVWNRTSDRLWTVSMIAGPSARLRRYHVTDVTDFGVPELDITLDGFGCDPKFDFSWVAISPDDRWAVFPLWQGSDRRLSVVDQVDGTVRSIPGNGPVGFTPDGSTIVSYGTLTNELYLTDVVSLVTEVILVPSEGELHYFTTWDGTWIVVSTLSPTDQLVVYDYVSDTLTELPGPHVSLDEFVTRPAHQELWLASDLALYTVSLSTSSQLVHVPVPFAVRHLNILPSRDWLVTSPPQGSVIRFFDMETKTVAATVDLPALFP